MPIIMKKYISKDYSRPTKASLWRLLLLRPYSSRIQTNTNKIFAYCLHAYIKLLKTTVFMGVFVLSKPT